jgi:hypothetical protein
MTAPVPLTESVAVEAMMPVPTMKAGGIRPFRREDLPAVVALRRAMYRHSAHRSPEELAAYLTRVFLDPCRRDVDLPSLVHLDPAGDPDGFVGLIPRSFRFRQRALRVAVPTQLMVRPGSPVGTAQRLLRTLLDGPQDLTFSDAANESARRLWLQVGGSVAAVPSLSWTLPLRRARFALTRFHGSPWGRLAGVLARPACALLDLRDPPGLAAGRVESLDPVRHLPILRSILDAWPLHPDYDPALLAWQSQELARRQLHGPLTARLVRDTGGTGIGWYVYFLNRGGVAEVVQLGARPGEVARVLNRLVHEAWRHGVVALSGRLEQGLMAPLGVRGLSLERSGPWCLVAARDPAIRAAVLGGEAFLSRLEGEWWLNF